MEKLQITTHTGDIDIVDVDFYDAVQMAEKINDNNLQAIAIGNYVYSRIDIKNIRPLETVEEEPEKPTEPEEPGEQVEDGIIQEESLEKAE